jgi:methylmalonyl-CoA mutase
MAKSGVTGDAIEALTSSTYDGITIQPLYTTGPSDAGRPGRAPFVRGATVDAATVSGWDVRQQHADPDPARANAAILNDLANGVTSVWLRIGEGAISVADLERVLDGVYLDLAPIVLDAGTDTAAATAAWLGLAAKRSIEPGDLAGSAGADPLGHEARTGIETPLGILAEVANQIAGYPKLRAATVDATIYHDAGGSDSDEIAIATAVGVAYLRALTDAGLDVQGALRQLEFRFAVGADQFLSIAKLRAAREVWSRVAELSGAADAERGQYQHAVTSGAMMTRRDAWVNLLRTTTACFAAAVGGADAITVAPFDSAIGQPDDFGRRIARNTQSILHDESSLARVIDPAGGSWYVETVSAELAQVAWAKFTEIERAGGAAAALRSGHISDLLGTTRVQRETNLAHRTDPITGVSEFALLGEQLVSRPPAAPQPSGGLPSGRYSEPFEQLVQRAEAARATVFLAALGPVGAHSGRLGFASNLFVAGGIEPLVGSGTDAEILTAFAESGSTVACLCSSDKVYADSAARLAQALKTAGATWVWLAGPNVPDDAAASVDGRLFAGGDALSVLETTLTELVK